MMNFRTITAAAIKLLGDSAAGRFSVTGYQRDRAASEARNNKRNVQFYFSQGDFPTGSGAAYGPTNHQMTFTVGLTVTAACRVNLTVINAPNSTQAQVVDALAAMQDAAFVADEMMDELMEIVYQILMDARNIDLGLPIGTVASRWVSGLKKDNPMPQGTLLTLTGEATFTCQTSEDIPGDTPEPMSEGITVNINVGEDEVPLAAVITGVDLSGGVVDDVQYENADPIEY